MSGAARPPRRPAHLPVTIAFLAGVAVVVGLRKIGSWDAFWHLRVGRTALLDRAALATDVFSFSAEGTPWAYKDLLADAGMWLAYAALGFAGLCVLKGLAGAAGALGLYAALPHPAAGDGSRQRLAAWMLLAGAWVAAVGDRIVDRPLMVSMACFPALLALVERARRAAAPGAAAGAPALVRAFVPLVALQAVWLLLHRGALAGVVVLVGLALALTAGNLAAHRGRLAALLPAATPAAAAWAWASVAAAAVLGLLNPCGAAVYTSALRHAGTAVYRQSVSEFQALSLGGAIEHFPATVAIAALAVTVTAASLVRRARRPHDAGEGPDLWHAGVVGLFLALSTTSVRWYPYLAAASVVALAQPALALVRAVRRVARTPAPRGAAWLLVALLLAGADTVSGHERGVGPLADRYPSGAVAFARTQALGPRVANAFRYGGWLLWDGWPDFRPLVDGRNDMVYAPDFYEAALRTQADPAAFEAMDDRFRFDWVLAANTAGYETHRMLASDPRWWLVYWSEPALVYVRADQRPDLSPLRYRLIHPADPVGSLGAALRRAGTRPSALAAVEAEVLRMRDASPDGLRANTLLVLLLHHLGSRYAAARDAAIEHLREVGGDHPAVAEVLRRVGTLPGPEAVVP